MQLLERDNALDQLNHLLSQARDGAGHIALVRGEAGIGKTSLIDRFVADLEDAFCLWGACDDLVAARPLGPLWDMAISEPQLEESLRDDERISAFRAILDLISRSLRPTVLVIEDVHWADVATLDLIKYVGKRISHSHGLLILTYRDGEIVGDQPLRSALGDLPYGVVERIALEPLSLDSIATLTSDKGNAEALLRLTGGNPFFVSEALVAEGETVPISISDAVNARVQRLSPDARALVELASVAPSRIEIDVVKSVLGPAIEAIAESEAAGILEVVGNALRFRHELARRAVEAELPEIRKRDLNAACLVAGEELGLDMARLSHHALAAGDPEAVLRLIPQAARRAASLESHREAVANLRALEPYLHLMTQEELADHYDLWAYEEYLWDVPNELLVNRAIELRRGLGDPAALGRTLLSASRIAWVNSNRAEAIARAEEAVAVLLDVGGEDLALAYSTLSQLAMLGNHEAEAVEYGQRALAITGDRPSRAHAHALNNIGAAQMLNGSGDGVAKLKRSLEISKELGLPHDEARAAINLAWGYLWMRRLDEAEVWIDRAQSIMAEAEMATMESYALTMGAMLRLYRGDWAEADEIARGVLGRSVSLQTSRATTTMIAAKLSVRSGEPDAGSLVEKAIALAVEIDEMQRTAPAAEVAAEYVWLGGDLGAAHTNWCVEQLQLAMKLGGNWNAAELALWLYLNGTIEVVPESIPTPVRLLADGRWQESADWWHERGYPYDRAVALSRGDTEARIESLRILDGLGAVPLASRIRSELNRDGVKGVPRGPQPATRDNPLGLTPRQSDVLELLKEGLTNAEIADRLFISIRTVDHHVSAILSKLGAENRSEAAQLAAEMAG